MFTDTHCHINDERYENIDDVVAEFRAAGVDRVVCVGYDAASSFAARDISDRYEEVYFAAGIHPDGEREATKENLARIKELCRHEKCVAVGEIGLDYHYEDACPRETQKHWMERQLALAVELDLPVIVHDREAHEDTLRLLADKRPAGVVHCFSGSVEMMREVVRLGMYVGLGGVVTFKNARRPVEVAAAVPEDRLLLETDAPYMAPVPFRGKRCDSTMIAYTAARIAEIRGVSVEELLAATAANARRLFRL